MPEPPSAPAPMSAQQRKTLLWYGGAGMAALAVIWWVMRRRAAATSDQPPPDMTGYSPATGGASGYQPTLFGYQDPGTGAFISGVGASGVGSVFGPATNAEWAQQVEAYLVKLGYDATATGAALGKYLTGQTLSTDQTSTVQAALGFFGNPPQTVPAISTAPPTGQYPKPDPTLTNVFGNEWITIQPTDRFLADLVTRGYGTSYSDSVNMAYNSMLIHDANPQINWTKPFVPGTQVFIPAIPK